MLSSSLSPRSTLRKVLRQLGRRVTRPARNRFLEFAPPGHFYSPIPDNAFVERCRERLFARDVAEVPGVEIHADEQLALLRALSGFYAEMPFEPERSDRLRYGFENRFFKHADAFALYAMMRQYQPRRIIEVGAGFSSAVMLDTNDLFMAGRVRCTFIDPAPERLLSLMSAADRTRHRVIAAPVQDVPLNVFSALQANDFLFIDSSHVAKVGSDVVHLLTHVLPLLNRGVVIHFHDVFWPFEYPEEWIHNGRAWNECYVLKAFLQFNSAFRILLFNSYLGLHHRRVLQDLCPTSLRNTGGSLWLLKTGEPLPSHVGTEAAGCMGDPAEASS